MAAQRAAQRVISGGPRGPADAQTWLGGVLTRWQVRSALTSRWLAPAQDVLEQPEEMVISAEYDDELLLFTVEISRNGRRLYGIDDWVG